MAIGLAVGIAGGLAERRLLRRLALPEPALHASVRSRSPPSSSASRRVAHGSGFLAVFVAGLIRRRRRGAAPGGGRALPDGALDARGDRRLRRARPDDRARRHRASTLGRRPPARGVRSLLARPLASRALLAPTRSPRRAAVRHVGRAEGACRSCSRVALGRHVPTRRIYEIVFVVVLASVVVQGSSIPCGGADRLRR